tara:strand:- start:4845 stop:5030 length:186 start_codon:yes stop_codon:yes gene_type:complete
MNVDLLLQIVLTSLSHVAELNALLEKVKSEGRTDLTEEEVALVRGRAQSAVDRFIAATAVD